MAKSKIVKDLANGTVDTITALKRAKVLVSELDNHDLINWIDYELIGYPANAKLPDYRITQGRLTGAYMIGLPNNYVKYSNVSIPLGNMPQEAVDALLTIEFRDSIAALKCLSASGQEHGIGKSIPADCFPTIVMYNNNPLMRIVKATVKLSTHELENIFSIIDNKLLDILMTLEREFGKLDELDIDISDKSADELQAIADKILVLIYNNNSITIGNENKFKDTKISTSN